MSKNALQFHLFNRQKLPMIMQEEQADCGHACIAMISNYWGHKLDLPALRRVHDSSQRGAKLSDLMELLERLGFRSRALKVSLEEIHFLKTPAILHWNLNHFVVLKKTTKKYVTVHDPALGVKEYTWEEFSHFYSGVALEIDKSSDFTVLRSENKLRLLPLFKSFHGVFRFVFYLLAISLSVEVFSLINPLFLQYVTDNVVGADEKSNLTLIACSFLIFASLHIFTEFTRGNMLIYITKNLSEQLSSNIITSLFKLPLEYFEKRSKGDLHTKFQSIHEIQRKIGADFVSIFLDAFFILINFSIMVLYSGTLTVIVSVFLIVNMLLRYFSLHTLNKHCETSIQEHSKTLSVFLESLQCILPIKTFTKEKSRIALWRNCFIKSLNADIRIEKTQLIFQASENLLTQIEYITVICAGASLVLANNFSMGMLMAFLSYRMMFINKAHAITRNLVEYKLLKIPLRRLSDIVSHPPEQISHGFGKQEEAQGSLTLQQVSFRYHEHHPWIFNGISLAIKAGEKVAIIGPSGCGKSTLLKVLMGLFQAQEGEIFIDGFPLQQFGTANYRSMTASVMQDDCLLTGTITENIIFFDEEYDLENVFSAAKHACIHEFIITLPMGYNTLIGEMGSSLSGGQKQRLLLARALYRNPRFLFLDEATSHLDCINEKNINASLQNLKMTQIIIAHRKETIAMADRVIDLSLINQDISLFT